MFLKLRLEMVPVVKNRKHKKKTVRTNYRAIKRKKEKLDEKFEVMAKELKSEVE